MNKKCIFLVLVMMMNFQAQAYDFSLSNKDGVLIYYDFQGGSGNKVMVVAGSRPYSYSGFVNIPDSVIYEGTTYGVETIGSEAFRYCDVSEVILPPKLKTIREFAFSDCQKLTCITIPDGVTIIRDRAFYQCATLKTVSGCSNLTTIGQYVFSYCTALESIELGEKVSTIEDMAFVNCSSLKNITLPESLTEISIGVFSMCSDLKTISIPKNITKIGEGAFLGCSGLTSITIPDGTVAIDDGAFIACDNLEKFVIGEKLTSIGKNVFYNCLNLREFTVSEKNTSFSEIEGVLVNKDKTLLIQFPSAKSTDFIVPDVIRIIGERAFAGCENVNTIIFPNNVTAISREAFADCINLTNIHIGNGVDSIGPKAFQNCRKLESFELPAKLSHIADSVFQNCHSLGSIIIPDGTITIGVSAFEYCYLQDLTIGKGVTAIGDYAFFVGCMNSTLIIPDNVTKIGYAAFYGSNAAELVIGEKVQEIANVAFYNMYHLKIVYIRNSVPPSIKASDELFYYGSWPYVRLPTLYVPIGSGDSYRKATYWNLLYIEEKDFIVANNAINKESITVINSKGGIMINCAEPTRLAIYNVSGQLVYNEYLIDRKEIRLSRGIYFLKTNILTKKVFVE